MRSLVLGILLILIPLLSHANAIPNDYPVASTTLSTMMSLSEEWQMLGNEIVPGQEEALPTTSRSIAIETHIFDLYTMLMMEEDHARNLNLSKFACEALITNISLFKSQLNDEIVAFKEFYRKPMQADVRKYWEKFGNLLEKTQQTVMQLEAETKKNYVTLDV
jgi:hypothetical protein